MALSKADNFEQAQAAIKCDLCGGEDGVKHYCLICEETMCPTCKAIHNKARATRDHKVVLREERHTKDQGSTFCKKHPDQKTSLYCDTCTIPVCSKCVSGAHYGHKFSDFSLVLENFKREIKDSKKKLETKMEEADALIQTGNQSWKDYENIVEKIRSSICQNYKSLLDKRENELTRISHLDKTAWKTAKDQLDEEKTKISRCLAQHEKCLSSTTITGMVELLKESEVLRRKILDPVEIVPPSYQEASASSIGGIGVITRQILGKALVISSFCSTLKGIPSICYAGNGEILLGSRDSNDIHVLKRGGQIVHKRENVLKKQCHSLAITKSGDILVSSQGGKRIYMLDGQNKLTTLFYTSPYETRLVTVTQKQEILVALRKNVDSTFKGRVELHKGGDESYHRRDIGSEDLYEWPIQAVELQDGGFCISDYGKQRLMVLNADGNLIQTIKNPLGRREFWPRGICIDKAGNILATDQYNDCVYVIGKDMSVRELVGKAEGFKDPRCLCVDDDNNLWISQFHGEVKVVKYI